MPGFGRIAAHRQGDVDALASHVHLFDGDDIARRVERTYVDDVIERDFFLSAELVGAELFGERFDVNLVLAPDRCS